MRAFSTTAQGLARIFNSVNHVVTAMPIAFLLIAMLILVAVLSITLRKNEQKKSMESAELHTPLPPLEIPEKPHREPVGIAGDLTPGFKPLSWQEEVRHLRDAGLFQEAITLCKRQYPRILAFRQTLITLRASLREDEAIVEETLVSLYKTAILGSAAKAIDGTLTVNLSADSPLLEDPRQHWNSLGYKHLELLNKTDCKLLEQHWGKPETHSDIASLLLN